MTEPPIETVWQLPVGDVKGIVLLLPGTQRSATDMLKHDEIEECKSMPYFRRCGELPEEVQWRQTALSRGYAVVSVSSSTGSFGQWGPVGLRDFHRVSFALKYVRVTEKLREDLPVFAVGGGHGGEFLGELAAKGLKYLKCIAPVSSGLRIAKGHEYPADVPAIFVHMARNKDTQFNIVKSMCMLDKKGATTVQIPVQPKAVSSKFLMRKGFGLEQTAARKVIHILRQQGYLDSRGFLTEDPSTDGRWQKAMSAISAEIGGVGEDTSKVNALLQLAYGQRDEFTAEHAERTLDFCEDPSLTTEEAVKEAEAEEHLSSMSFFQGPSHLWKLMGDMINDSGKESKEVVEKECTDVATKALQSEDGVKPKDLNKKILKKKSKVKKELKLYTKTYYPVPGLPMAQPVITTV